MLRFVMICLRLFLFITIFYDVLRAFTICYDFLRFLRLSRKCANMVATGWLQGGYKVATRVARLYPTGLGPLYWGNLKGYFYVLPSHTLDPQEERGN